MTAYSLIFNANNTITTISAVLNNEKLQLVSQALNGLR